MNPAVLRYILLPLSIFFPNMVLANEGFQLLQTAFQQHCIDCHGVDGEGSVNLSAFKTTEDAQTRPELIKDVIAVLQDRRMPPETESPISDSVREQLITTLLDNTIFTLGAGMGDGTTHHYNDLPLVVADGGGGTLQLGKHIHCKPGTPLANLWLTQLNCLGIARQQYADSTGTMPEILV